MVKATKYANLTNKINSESKKNSKKVWKNFTTSYSQAFRQSMYETDSDSSSSDRYENETSSYDTWSDGSSSSFDSYDADEESNDSYEKYTVTKSSNFKVDKSSCKHHTFPRNEKAHQTLKTTSLQSIPSFSAKTTTFDEHGVTTRTLCHINEKLSNIVIEEVRMCETNCDEKQPTVANNVATSKKIERCVRSLSIGDESLRGKVENVSKKKRFCLTAFTENLNFLNGIKELNKSQSIELLHSPKLARRNIANVSKALPFIESDDSVSIFKRGHAIKSVMVDDDDRLQEAKQTLKLDNYSEAGTLKLHERKTLLTSREERLLTTATNNSLISPNLKRKQIDITNSPAYKEIYAHNLRLYSAVLAKQIAKHGQVGREMNEIRKTKNKEKALQASVTNSTETKVCVQHKQHKVKRHTEARDQLPDRDINFTNAKERTADHNEENDIIEETNDEFKSDIMLQKEFQYRSKAANFRKAYCRKRIESFDMTIQQADMLLQKLKAPIKFQPSKAAL